LVHVAHQQHRRVAGDRPHQLMGQRQVEHARIIDMPRSLTNEAWFMLEILVTG
jgi:hypothetical protein